MEGLIIQNLLKIFTKLTYICDIIDLFLFHLLSCTDLTMIRLFISYYLPLPYKFIIPVLFLSMREFKVNCTMLKK